MFETLKGGQLTTTASSNGRAGKITVNATDKLIISGSDPNYNDRLTNFSIGIENIGANSGFFVSSTGAGMTGDIEVNSPKIILDNQGKLNAESASGNGGNIKLNSDLILLRRGSQITTNAGTASSSGDGGDININSRFIVAVPTENSDISANAFTGIGGNVNIRTRSILGITPASSNTSNSDITASSEFGVQGQITLAQPDVDPTQGILELPTQVVDISNQIGQLCPRGAEAFRRPLNQFIVTGRGSLPPNPLQPMPGRLGNRQLATLESNTHEQQTLERVDGNIETKPANVIIEAQGWIKNVDGTISLVAAVPTATPNNSPSLPTCPVLN